jgi:hypothetical protein
MTRNLIAVAAIVVAAGSASAQNPLAVAKNVANKAVSAENAHIAAEQRPDTPQPSGSKSVVVSNGAVTTGAAAPRSSAARPSAASRPSTASRPQQALTIASDTSNSPTTIMREEYDYMDGGRRDPFYSLLKTTELRPTMSDLRLTGILFDHSSGHSVATLRDVATNAQYRVSVGSTLGRMRVSIIRLKTIVFTIDEFGSTRQDSLFLGDSTKARGK